MLQGGGWVVQTIVRLRRDGGFKQQLTGSSSVNCWLRCSSLILIFHQFFIKVDSCQSNNDGWRHLIVSNRAHKAFDCYSAQLTVNVHHFNHGVIELSKTRSEARSWAGTGVSSLTLSACVLPQSFPQSCRVHGMLGVRGRTKHFKLLSFFFSCHVCTNVLLVGFVIFYKVPPKNSGKKKSKSAVFVMLKIEPW